jgi:hypothetical protein
VWFTITCVLNSTKITDRDEMSKVVCLKIWERANDYHHTDSPCCRRRGDGHCRLAVTAGPFRGTARHSFPGTGKPVKLDFGM